ncbi:MAG TPA: acetate--CoA ligase family protein [Solirubrobacteraceae bacterium]|nr:acetate--CoA ligase family protein [Solirubrobacteraceae bacterium]
MADLSRLLRPRSVAVVGASDRPGSYAAQALLNLETIGFPGAVWGVNPTRTEVLGRPCVPTLADLPEAADAVIVAIPAAGVPEVIEQAGARGCGAAVVFSAGFGEVAGGAALEQALVDAAALHGLPVCGPNCNGIVAPGARSALWGDALAPREPGHVALVSQSGNVVVNALATQRGLRFHTVISSGNQSVLTAADYLEALAVQDGVRSVAMYLEDDGGPRLCDGLAACAAAGVRVAVLKVGNSPAGAAAAAAHSGSLAGDQRVFSALLAEAGAVAVEDLHELLEVSKALAASRPARRGSPPGSDRLLAEAGPLAGLAILTCSGGDSAQGADEAARRGLPLPAFAPETSARLRELLPPAATVANPLDYTAMIWGDADALSELVQTVASDPAIDQLLVFYDQPRDLDAASAESWGAVRDGLIAGSDRVDVPMIVSSTLPELLDDEAAWRFARHGIAPVAGLRAGLLCAEVLQGAPGDPQRLREIALTARAAGRAESAGWLAEHESKELLRDAGVTVPAGRVVVDEDDAVAALSELGAPLVLKLSSAGVQHKTELGGVALRLDSADAVRLAYRRLAELVAVHGGSLMAERMAAGGTELLVAARADTIVPVLVIALGGIWTELLDDAVIVPLPATAPRIERALRSLRGAPIFTGGRGRPVGDIAAAATLIARCGELLLGRGLELVELNPVIVGEAGAVAVDASVLLGLAERVTG